MKGTTRGGFSVATLAIITASAAVLVAGPSAAATYKWVDDQGVVHYSDKVPPEAASKGATVLDKQGRPVKKIEPAPTPEQRKAMEAEAEQKRIDARAQEERTRKDRALILSYTAEADIDVAKKRALATIDSQIQSAEAYSAELKKRQQDVAKKKAGYVDKPIPSELERESSNIDIELSRETTLIQQKREESITVSARYDADKQRWHEIMADQQRATAAAAQAADQAAKNVPTKTSAGTPTAAKK